MPFNSAFNHRGYRYQIFWIALESENEISYSVTIGNEMSINSTTITLLPLTTREQGKITWKLKGDLGRGKSLSHSFIQAIGAAIEGKEE